MPGTKAGGLKAAATIKAKSGEDFYRVIGRKGGQSSNTGGFASLKKGSDGLTGPQRAVLAGTIGGMMSKRGPAKRQQIDTASINAG